jgi:hypothetical protein
MAEALGTMSLLTFLFSPLVRVMAPCRLYMHHDIGTVLLSIKLEGIGKLLRLQYFSLSPLASRSWAMRLGIEEQRPRTSYSALMCFWQAFSPAFTAARFVEMNDTKGGGVGWGQRGFLSGACTNGGRAFVAPANTHGYERYLHSLMSLELQNAIGKRFTWTCTCLNQTGVGRW